MTLVQKEPKSIKIGTTDVKRVMLGSTQVRPSGWKPGADTLAYRKLEGDCTDETGNYDGTGTNISFVTDSSINKDVMYCAGSSANYMEVTTLPSSTTDQITLLIRAKQDFTYENYRNLFGTHTTNAGQHGGSNNDGLRMATESNQLIIYSGYGYTADPCNITSYISTSELQSWGLWGFTYDRTTKEMKFYYNGDYKISNTYSIQPTTGWIDKFTLGQGYNKDANRAFKGWISHTVLENKIRTAQEVSDYYNQTKGNYGIS